MNSRYVLRALLPYSVRIELLRLRRLPTWLVERSSIARTRLSVEAQTPFQFLIASHASPLERTTGTNSARLQQGKEINVALAARHLNGLSIRSYETLSYHHAVGRPSRFRGFRMGLELHRGGLTQGIGGGCCQISNMLYLLALRGGMKIVERHRHGIDLFPDEGRTVPFGCGATVFYNYADLRFENPLPYPVLCRFRIEGRCLVGELWATEKPGWNVEVYEIDHRFYRESDHWVRENRIRRSFHLANGTLLMDQEIAHNQGRVAYQPPDGALCCEP